MVKNVFQRMKRINSSLRVIITFFLLCIILFLVGWVSEIPHLFIQTENLCLQYFSDFELYNNHPYCIQGPITYAVAYLLYFLPLTHDIILQLFWIVAMFILIYFTYLIKKQETTDAGYFVLCLLILIFFLKENDFATYVALLFLLPGFYLLYYTKYIFWGTLLLSFSLFSKVQTIIIIIPALFFYLFYYYKTLQKPLSVPSLKKLFMRGAIVFTPPSILFLLSLLVYNHFLDYYIFVHQAHPITTPLGEILRHIFLLDYSHVGLVFLIYIGMSISLLRLFNKKFDIFSFIIVVLLPIFFIKIFSTFGIPSGVSFYRYFSVFIPFYFILLYKIKREIREYSKLSKSIFLFFIILLLIPLYQACAGFTFDDITDGSIFNDVALVAKIQREVSYPLLLLNTSGQVLVSKEYTTSFGDEYPFTYISQNQFSNINPDINDSYAGLRPDMSFAPQFIQLGIISSLDEYNPDLHVNFTQYKEQLDMGVYTIIISRPYTDFLTYFLETYSEYINFHYCGGYIPYLVGPYFPTNENYVMVYFNDIDMCEKYRNTVISYYNNNFERLCHRSKLLGKTIVEILSRNQILIEKDCNSFSKTAEFITPTQIQQVYLAIFVYIFLAFIIFKEVYHLIRKRQV